MYPQSLDCPVGHGAEYMSILVPRDVYEGIGLSPNMSTLNFVDNPAPCGQCGCLTFDLLRDANGPGRWLCSDCFNKFARDI